MPSRAARWVRSTLTCLPFDEASIASIRGGSGASCGGRARKVLVALAGVQTNQFPRAQDLARQFKAEGFDVMIGGFHVSGSVAMAHAIPPECQAMIDEGVTLVLGEVEDRWTGLLQDAAPDGCSRCTTSCRICRICGTKPLPKVSTRLQRKFAVHGYGTIDAGRGCPVQLLVLHDHQRAGPRRCAVAARRTSSITSARTTGSAASSGIRHYFFTDDNFSRNPQWEAIFDGLIALRQDEGIAIDFMMQVDTAATRIPRFVEKAARAGCVQVFIGMESLREDNLKAAAKRQNRVGDVPRVDRAVARERHPLPCRLHHRLSARHLRPHHGGRPHAAR